MSQDFEEIFINQDSAALSVAHALGASQEVMGVSWSIREPPNFS
jgi:acetylglutamate kinase